MTSAQRDTLYQAYDGNAAEAAEQLETQSVEKPESQVDIESVYQRQGSKSGGSDREPAYLYSSDTSMPSQDGALQWSIGGVPLQQQLR